MVFEDRPPLSTRFTVVLTSVALVCAGTIGFLWWRAESQRLSGELQPASVSSTDARGEALAAAPGLAARVLSYDWRTYDQDVAAARGVMLPTFRTRYDASMAEVRDRSRRRQIDVVATTVGASIVGIDRERAEALLFVNVVTTVAGVRNQRIDQRRIMLTMTRADQDWRVAALRDL